MPWTSFCTRMRTRCSRGMPSARHAGCAVGRPGGGFVGPVCAALTCHSSFHEMIASGNTTRIVQQRFSQPEFTILWKTGLRSSAGYFTRAAVGSGTQHAHAARGARRRQLRTGQTCSLRRAEARDALAPFMSSRPFTRPRFFLEGSHHRGHMWPMSGHSFQSRAPQPTDKDAPSRVVHGDLRLALGLASRVSASARRQGRPQPS